MLPVAPSAGRLPPSRDCSPHPWLLEPALSRAGNGCFGAERPGNRDPCWPWEGGLTRGCPPAQHRRQSAGDAFWALPFLGTRNGAARV